MNENLQFVVMQRLERVKAALEKNDMVAYVVKTAAEVPALVQSLLPEGATISSGGSETLIECGVAAMLRNGTYCFLDRDAPDADKASVELASFTTDVYLASANAVTEAGEIYEIDGTGNRVAAIAYGPSSVVLVVGKNKIVPDIAAARRRNQEISGPANARRVGAATPCVPTGHCTDCNSPQRICCMELVLRKQRDQRRGRVKVILVGEDLGF